GHLAQQVDPGDGCSNFLIQVGCNLASPLQLRQLLFHPGMIDIDANAAATADENFTGSTFAARMASFHASFEDYHPAVKYDMIVSNPPFFVNDFKNADPRKELARHTDESFFAALIEKSFELLNEAGRLWLILPTDRAALITAQGLSHLHDHGHLKHPEVAACH
ncbi:MAG: hypothetical protein EOO88_24620, partial [Pedobacter sp.]